MTSQQIANSVNPDSQLALLQHPFVKIREEGELSSASEDEELSTSAKERPSGLNNPIGADPDKGGVVKAGSENTAVKPISPISHADAINVHARSSVRSESRIPVNKNPVAFRSTANKWIGKSGLNDDLVIVFSDNESGSDSECKIKKTAEVKGVVPSSEIRKPAPSSHLKVGPSQKTKGGKAKFQPNHGIYTRTFTFTPSNTNPYCPKLKNAPKPQVKTGFVVKPQNSLDQRGCKPKQATCLDIDELQDLRQKIAIRETEKKLNSSRKIRDAITGSSQKFVSDTEINIQKREREMQSKSVHPEVTEPDNKRTKYDPSGQGMQSSAVELVAKGPNSNRTGGQSDISCQQKYKALPNQHTETVLGAIECQKESDLLGNDFRQGFDSSSPGLGNQNLQALFAMEEMHDKELEEAQKDRHHCEIDEQVARKTYGEAQSALIEAITRCNSLYRQRERFSTQILSLLTGDVDSRFAARKDHVDSITTRVSDAKNKSIQGLLELDNSLEKELKDAQEFRFKCEIEERNFLRAYRRTQFALIEASDKCNYLYRKRQQLVTRANIEFFSRCYNQFGSSMGDYLNTPSGVDLDVIQSSQYGRPAHIDANQAGYDTNFRSTSNDPATAPYQSMCGNNIGSETSSEPDSSSSEPLAHLDSKVLQRAETTNVLDDDTHITSLDESDQAFLLQEAKLRSVLRARLGQRPLSQKVNTDVKGDQHYLERAADNSEKSDLGTSKLPLPQEMNSQLSSHGVDPNQDWNSQLSFRSAACPSGPFLKSAFSYMKNLDSLSCKSVQPEAENLEYISHNINNFKGGVSSSEETHFISLEDNQLLLSAKYIFTRHYESFYSNLEADPFWPLCMYELRGKCNDEQCCWQHIKTHLNQKTTHIGPIARSIDQQISNPVAASRLLLRKMVNAELSGNVGNLRYQANESNRKLSYLQSRRALAELEKSVPDVESSLETALVILDQEIDKFEGTDEALSLLSKAIEVDPRSSALWIIYLLVYYSTKRSDDNDDMFLHAVKNVAWSYELWLLYINSRVEFSTRLAAYDDALSALCGESYVPQSDSGSLILDIFLQMLDFLCMSGQVEMAIAKVLAFIHSTSTSDEFQTLLSRAYSLLSVPDKCILWVCSLYLGVYRRLPEAILIQFELNKELQEIDWPDVKLMDDEMQCAKKLMISVEQNVELSLDVVSPGNLSDLNLKSLHFFAVNHFRCKVALEGFDSGKLLAEKYIHLYPTCLELVLLMARMYSNDLQELSVSGFEEALCNWPKEVLGIHCIWNQYAAYALEKKSFDVAREVLCRWHESAYNCPPVECQLFIDEGCASQIQNTPSDIVSRADNMFRCLNLALYHKLQNSDQEARLLVTKALEIAPSDLFKHFIKEKVSFLLIDAQLMDGTSTFRIVKLLNEYMADPRASYVASRFLSKKFISNIKKPRVQQLVKKFLAEVSPDCAILNAALEAWFGPSLMPQSCSERKQLVNFVEAVMEIVPTNHQFVSRVFKHISEDFDSKDVSASSLLFWASNLLVNSLSEAVPVAPEYIWVEAAALLGNATTIKDISEKFHEKALSVYPFSIKLWKSYLNLSSVKHDPKPIIELAMKKGLQLGLPPQVAE